MVNHAHALPLRSSSPLVGLLAALALSACADTDAPGPTGARFATAALELALDFPSRERVCVDIALGDAAPSEVCATPDAWRATFQVAASCDLSTATVPARFWLTSIYDAHGYDALYDPCGAEGCALDVGCGTGPTRASLTLAYRAYREFSPVSVNASSAWFYGEAATCQRYDGADEPIALRWADGPHATAVLGYNVAQGFDAPAPAVLASTPILACGEVTCALPPTTEGEATARCSDGASVRYRSWLGAVDDGLPTRYLTLAVDLDSLAATGLTGCQLNAAATFAGDQLAELGRADAFPVARYHLPLLDDAGEVPCVIATLDGYGEVDDEVVTVEYLRGWNLTPVGGPGLALPPLCHTIDERGLTSTCD